MIIHVQTLGAWVANDYKWYPNTHRTNWYMSSKGQACSLKGHKGGSLDNLVSSLLTTAVIVKGLKLWRYNVNGGCFSLGRLFQDWGVSQ